MFSSRLRHLLLIDKRREGVHDDVVRGGIALAPDGEELGGEELLVVKKCRGAWVLGCRLGLGGLGLDSVGRGRVGVAGDPGVVEKGSVLLEGGEGDVEGRGLVLRGVGVGLCGRFGRVHGLFALVFLVLARGFGLLVLVVLYGGGREDLLMEFGVPSGQLLAHVIDHRHHLAVYKTSHGTWWVALRVLAVHERVVQNGCLATVVAVFFEDVLRGQAWESRAAAHATAWSLFWESGLVGDVERSPAGGCWR